MTLLRIILSEMRYRWVSTGLALLGVTVTVALFSVLFSEGRDVQRETRRITRDIGYNLRIISGATDMDGFWAEGFAQETFPEKWIHRLAEVRGLTYNHLIGSLQRRVEVRGRRFVLTGISPEYAPPGKKKPPMRSPVRVGTLELGYEAARHLEVKRGAQLPLLGRTFEVAEILGESGTVDDVRIFGALEDVQGLLDLPGMLNEIQAIDCLCLLPEDDPLTKLREQLTEVLPEARLFQMRKAADARARQRTLVREQHAFLLPVVLLACAGWMGVLLLLNVRQRLEEIGALRALGWSSGRIAGLVLGKALVIGAFGGLIGLLVAAAVTTNAPHIFPSQAEPLGLMLVLGILIGTPLLCAIACLIPAMFAVTQDPAMTLRGDA